MVVLGILRPLTHAVLDVALADPAARRAAHATVDGLAAPVALATGDPSLAAQSAAGVLHRGIAASTQPDASTQGALDTVEHDVGRLVSGDFPSALAESGAEKTAGALAGGVAQAATKGEMNVADGLRTTHGLAHGVASASDPARRAAQRGARAAGALAGGGIAAALADPADGADAARYGVQLGLRLDRMRVHAGASSPRVASASPAVGAAARARLGGEIAGFAVEWGMAGAQRRTGRDVPWSRALPVGRALGRGTENLVEVGARAASSSLEDGVSSSAVAVVGGLGRIAGAVERTRREAAVEAKHARAEARGDVHLLARARAERAWAERAARFQAGADRVDVMGLGVRRLEELYAAPGPRCGPTPA